jgi:hypothetical protein
MRYSFKKLSDEIKKRFNPNLLLEIGSNDGALITHFDKKKVIGIEPCKNLAKITKKKNILLMIIIGILSLLQKLKKNFKM